MDTTIQKKPKFTYGQFTQKNDDYHGEMWRRLGLLYAGGWLMKEHASEFIERAPNERGDFYRLRCKSTSYVNYLARLVGYLTGSLFNETLTMGAAKEGAGARLLGTFYEQFAADCDMSGTDFSQMMRLLLTDALVYRRALVQVDFPLAKAMPDGSPPTTLLEEEALGNNRAYVIRLPIESLFDWETTPEGRFRWCVLHRIRADRPTPFADRKSYCHEFRIWWLKEGRASVAVLRTKLVTKEEELTDDDELEFVDERQTSFTEIPICQLSLPMALWVGNQAGPLCQEHYQRRSDLMGSLCRSLVEIPYVKLGPEIPGVHDAVPSEAQQNPHRGDHVVERSRAEGNVTLGSQDEIGFAGPSGRAFDLASRECKDVREEIFASINAMALQLSNTAATVQRSGDSKREDRGAMAIILSFLATETREFAQRVMTMVSAGRGDSTKWVASGLNTFDKEDRATLLEDAASVAMVDIPSRRFNVEMKLKIALAMLPNATAKQKEEIRREIEAACHAESLDPFAREKFAPSHSHGEEES